MHSNGGCIVHFHMARGQHVLHRYTYAADFITQNVGFQIEIKKKIDSKLNLGRAGIFSRCVVSLIFSRPGMRFWLHPGVNNLVQAAVGQHTTWQRGELEYIQQAQLFRAVGSSMWYNVAAASIIIRTIKQKHLHRQLFHDSSRRSSRVRVSARDAAEKRFFFTRAVYVA